MLRGLRVVIVILIGCGAIGVALLIRARPGQMPVSETAKTAATGGNPQELTFRRTAILDGKTPDGVRYSKRYYKASDCVVISDLVMFFQSSARAQEEVQRETNNTSDVVERGPRLDNTGQEVGERVVLRSVGQQQQTAKIVWNKGPNYYSVTTSSLDHALHFEKAIQTPDGGRVFFGIDSAKTVTFDPISTSEGPTNEASVYKETQYRSSDCETVLDRTEYFDSPARAEEAMRTKLKESTGVIEDEAPKVKGTSQVGRRAVAMFGSELLSEHLEKTVVMWTDGREFHTIEGVFTYVLEFESRTYH